MIHNRIYIFHRVLSDPYSDVFYSEECQAKSFQYAVKRLVFSKPLSQFCYVTITRVFQTVCNERG